MQEFVYLKSSINPPPPNFSNGPSLTTQNYLLETNNVNKT